MKPLLTSVSLNNCSLHLLLPDISAVRNYIHVDDLTELSLNPEVLKFTHSFLRSKKRLMYKKPSLSQSKYFTLIFRGSKEFMLEFLKYNLWTIQSILVMIINSFDTALANECTVKTPEGMYRTSCTFHVRTQCRLYLDYWKACVLWSLITTERPSWIKKLSTIVISFSPLYCRATITLKVKKTLL